MPKDANGKAINHAPDSLDLFARILAFDKSIVHASNIRCCCLEHISLSHLCWNFRSACTNQSQSESDFHDSSASAVVSSVDIENDGKMLLTRSATE